MSRLNTPTHREIAARLRQTLAESVLSPLYPPGTSEDFMISLTEDRTVLGGLFPLGPDRVTVSLRTVVAQGCRMEPELLAMLLQANCRIGLGAFGIDIGEPGVPGDGVVFEYSLLASDCTLAQVEAAVGVLLSVAGDYETEIVNRFGGHGPLGL